MPWERNELFFAIIDNDGEIQKIKKFSNKLVNEEKNVSFFQPYWVSDNILVCSEDSTGWWNLLFLDLTDITNICLLYTSPSPRDATLSRMPSSA